MSVRQPRAAHLLATSLQARGHTASTYSDHYQLNCGNLILADWLHEAMDMRTLARHEVHWALVSAVDGYFPAAEAAYLTDRLHRYRQRLPGAYGDYNDRTMTCEQAVAALNATGVQMPEEFAACHLGGAHEVLEAVALAAKQRVPLPPQIANPISFLVMNFNLKPRLCDTCNTTHCVR